MQRLRLANDGDEMIRGAFASFALGAAVFSQGGLAHAEPSTFWPFVFAQATTPETQPAPAQGQQPATPPQGQQPAAPAQPAPQPGQQAAPSAPAQPGVTQLPPVKVTPEAAPSGKPAPRVTQKPKREAPPVRQAARPAVQPVAAPPAEGAAETAAEAATPGGFDQGIPMSPVQGSEIPLEKVPSAVGQVTSVEIERTGSPAVEQSIQQYVPGAIISDVNGNAFSTDVQFRGFTA